MDTNFWHQKWKENEIAFHQPSANPLLVKYFQKLSLAKGSRVFVPLCGKTLDMAWLLANGYRVVGSELIETAVEQLFSELGVEPKISIIGKLKHYRAKDIDILVGDFFDLSQADLGLVDAIYDRAALVALPEEMRKHYAAHLVESSNGAPQLLLCYEYDQSLMEGPPFSISGKEVSRHYQESYELEKLESAVVADGLKGLSDVKENVWLLHQSL
ncbi:thiopurine S-methyltransferase [Aliikangiella coralliicola]|uniref:Thiopurine S-methyltransferase n=1 Tax=Aliikangiella coralliicola TaxID=2592383 RepID=A0A545UJ05_9GAMM|nr:thiopurine S-methyltransferase [Aliikangiella coralliicola]TQV89413.1 thiopurine S-methyltransferase [Aliikangiella coralliicola]